MPTSTIPSPTTPSSTSDRQLFSLFSRDRIHSSSVLLLLYLPLGLFILTIRIFLSFHAFVVACLLRKANLLRALVLRVMCALCGVVVTSTNVPDPSSRVLVANHVSYLDHLAIDLLHPCMLASVWDIPALLRWCFGYVDLGAREGRQELVNRAKKFIQNEEPSLLAFPESALTSGKVGLLRFATWPFEVCQSIQPISIRVTRPFFSIEPTVLGSAWWQDLLYFLILPITNIHVTFLPMMKQAEDETADQFAMRVSKEIAKDLGVIVTEFTSHDAVDAAKKHLKAREAAASMNKPTPRPKMDARKKDEAAMAIKQAHPTIAVVDIRRDLEMTNDPRQTIDRIKMGILKPTVVTNKKTVSSTSLSDPSEWRRLFHERKWSLIETNRAKYLEKAAKGDTGSMDSGDH